MLHAIERRKGLSMSSKGRVRYHSAFAIGHQTLLIERRTKEFDRCDFTDLNPCCKKKKKTLLNLGMKAVEVCRLLDNQNILESKCTYGSSESWLVS